MKIGMIGIGDIAQKAYLPVLARKKELDIVLCSRNEELLMELAKTYRGTAYVTDISELIRCRPAAVFVHAATEAHFELCRELLENGIHVYVDKPVSFHIEEVRELFRLAKEKNRILRVGFNRREAPMIKGLLELEKPDVVIHQKNRTHLPAQIRNYVFNDFIHVVDTIRYLLGDNLASWNVSGKTEGGQLYSVVLRLAGSSGTAIGIMNRESGKTEERIEYICPGEKRIIEDINELTIFQGGAETKHKFGDWEPVLFRRGFHQITDRFLKDVVETDGYMEEDEDSLATHELCEEIVKSLEAAAGKGR